MESTASYLLRRMLWVPPVLLIVSFFTFALVRLGPGDPILVAAGQFRDPEAFERIRAARGLDKPLYEQYFIYLKNVVTKGQLGESFRFKGVDVSEIVFPAIWRSAQYNTIALAITLGVGIPLGVYAARNQGTWRDPTAISIFLLLESIPAVIMVQLILLVFALELGILPASGWPRDCPLVLPGLPRNYECIGVASREAIIPIIALSLGGVAGWARFTRAFTLDVMKEDYVRTARSKGISEMAVMTRHVLRNAMLPLTTMLGFAFLGLFTGSFFVETLTGIPGYGRLTLEAVNGRDYDLLLAITTIGATLFLVMTIVIDIAYTFIDPRIRYGSRNR
ncbi:MAG TPA: ABC transporter permease [Dehalococcoidia bacterium]|nr:ABC transporter permease [Dehalococcoidia bacterium]